MTLAIHYNSMKDTILKSCQNNTIQCRSVFATHPQHWTIGHCPFYQNFSFRPGMLPTLLSPRLNLDPNVDDTIISVNITNECIAAYKELLYRRGADKPAFVIYKISDDERSIVVEESSPEKNYEAFLQKLTSAHDSDGKPAPRYAIYDVEYDLLEDGRR